MDKIFKCGGCSWSSHRWVDFTRTLKSDPTVSNRLLYADCCFREVRRNGAWTVGIHAVSRTSNVAKEYPELVRAEPARRG
ncbi:hypothetical protein [Actinomadura rupiterrae]|uniref:hypothetical protein n=1 Tax=Actinomadura rupiterrae TaxID=559627 RepID=UPI0020A5CF54|nr:hypothetical protein [Actinomadura rupiterrae]MCP2337507.1 hypothetical protein [Actinomadura rupiterrae]